MNAKIKNYTTVFLSTLIYLSFIFGFYYGENSIGSGGYQGDLSWMWKNFEIYKNNNLLDAILHKEFFGNRTPLLYILHIYFNPFISDIDSYRLSVFLISLIAPIIFYICLVQNFKNTNKTILFFISSFILLSPFFRTSAYWGLEINYAIITFLLTFSLINLTFNGKNKKDSSLYVLITLLTFVSSLTIYFDQKFLIVPIIVLFKIIKSRINPKFKIFSIINFLIYSIPFLYLIYIWNGIVPPTTQSDNPNTITTLSRVNFLWFEHLGYATTMIAFYLLPMIFFKNENILVQLKKFYSEKLNYVLFIIFFIYLTYLLIFFNFYEFTNTKYFVGLGFIHKISIILFENILLQEIFTYFSFFISWIILIFFLEKNLNNLLVISYFYLLSLILWPLMQEYFDPVILLFAFTIFSTKLFINYKNSIFLFLYLITFLICANFYYH